MLEEALCVIANKQRKHTYLMVLKEVDLMFQIFHTLIATAIGLSINYTLPAPNHLH